MFVATPSHEAIFQAIKDKKHNVMIDAKAGSGKTTTIIEGLKFVPNSEKCLFLAFNRSIAQELEKRVPEHCEARTLNSVGHRIWLKHLMREGIIKNARQLKLDAGKNYWIARDLCEDMGWDRSRATSAANVAKKLMQYAKAFAVGVIVPDKWETWVDLMVHFDVRWDDDRFGEEDVIEIARKAYEIGLKDWKRIDFDDQLLLPVANRAKTFKYDRVLVDESQDLTKLQHELLNMLLKRNGQLIAVGDPHQAIYGFRGADSSSMTSLKERFDCEVYPLSVTYRCSKLITERAQRYVSEIESHDKAPEGMVDDKRHAPEEAPIVPGDMVVSRTVAPAVRLCYALLQQRRRAQVLGRDIGKGLVKHVDDLKADSISDLLGKQAKWLEKQVERLTKRDASESTISQVYDKAECVQILCEGVDTVAELKDLIDEMFTGYQNSSTVTICTIHKSKGLEADRVWILNPQLIPHPMARQPWEREQEHNLAYVAVTRAKSFLGYAQYPN